MDLIYMRCQQPTRNWTTFVCFLYSPTPTKWNILINMETGVIFGLDSNVSMSWNPMEMLHSFREHEHFAMLFDCCVKLDLCLQILPNTAVWAVLSFFFFWFVLSLDNLAFTCISFFTLSQWLAVHSLLPVVSLAEFKADYVELFVLLLQIMWREGSNMGGRYIECFS